MTSPKLAGLLCLPLFFSACATAPTVTVPPVTATAWQVALPHQGSVAGLADWWQRQGDALLVELIDAAQQVSPSIAAAHSRIEQARATRVAAGAALLPSLDGAAGVSRASQQSLLPSGTTSQIGVQSAWEIDLFGANRATRDGAQARLEGAQAGWHAARVSVAAEVASQYYSLRACQKLLTVARDDAQSRSESARLAQLTAEAGLQAPAVAALARASSAEGKSRATRQETQCEIDVKTLVVLTAMAEPVLRQRLAAVPVELPQSVDLGISSLPAQTLAQRPDVFAAERELTTASAAVGSARAQLYPRLSLSGAIGMANFRSGGVGTNLDTWTVGPLALTLPLFDGGSRSANVDAAVARYQEAEVNYRATVRQAVGEVEQALLTLNSTALQGEDAGIAVEGYRASFVGTESRYKFGLASLVELEDVRRVRLLAETNLVVLQRERALAWIALYRAAGGGWTRPNNNQ